MTEFAKILKANPYHDASGKFSSKDGAPGSSVANARADQLKLWGQSEDGPHLRGWRSKSPTKFTPGEYETGGKRSDEMTVTGGGVVLNKDGTHFKGKSQKEWDEKNSPLIQQELVDKKKELGKEMKKKSPKFTKQISSEIADIEYKQGLLQARQKLSAKKSDHFLTFIGL